MLLSSQTGLEDQRPACPAWYIEYRKSKIGMGWVMNLCPIIVVADMNVVFCPDKSTEQNVKFREFVLLVESQQFNASTAPGLRGCEGGG